MHFLFFVKRPHVLYVNPGFFKWTLGINLSPTSKKLMIK